MPRKPTLDQAAVIAVVRAADRLRRRYAALFDRYDLTLQQFNVLRILRGARPAGLPTLAIAERMIERAPGITRLIDRLVRKGLVARCPGEADRRVVVCRITPQGLQLLKRLDHPVARADRPRRPARRDRPRRGRTRRGTLRHPCRPRRRPRPVHRRRPPRRGSARRPARTGTGLRPGR